MRKKIVAGNWKMNKTFEEAVNLVKELAELLKENKEWQNDDILVILSPPFPFIHKTDELVKDFRYIKIAAQNCHSEEKGAFTGEVSAPMIRSAGAEYVIIGHSERRMYFKETNEFIAKKIDIALKSGLIPIFCCGEILPDRKNENHFNVIKRQLKEGVFHLSENDFSKMVVAYEPIWAIGTGVTATPAQAQEMHAFIRKQIAGKYNQQIADNTTILYGGSCNSKNAKELFANKDVDGGLIGGASLIASEFATIINSF
jgi:triosephosphate isomerase